MKLGRVTFQCDLDLDANVREMFVRNYEPEIVRVFQRFLCSGDVVVDAGANIGYFSAVALDLVGTRGQVHAFEPVREIYNRLLSLRDDNPEFAFTPNNCALGEKEGELPLAVTKQKNIGWNTMVPGFMDSADIREIGNVPVRRLDVYLAEHQIDSVRLVKIDTEGFEFPVLKGLTGFLRKTRNPPAIIMELAPEAYPKLGTDLDALDAFLREYNYAPRTLEGRQTVSLQSLATTTNLLLLPFGHGIG